MERRWTAKQHLICSANIGDDDACASFFYFLLCRFDEDTTAEDVFEIRTRKS